MTEKQAPYNGESTEDQEYQIREEAPHDYYCQIPNIVDIMELSTFAYRLYGHMKKVAGEAGRCWQSTKTLAKSCGMSMGKVSDAKIELENVYPPLIRIETKKFDRGIYHEIAITDIWQINHEFWTGSKTTIKTASGAVFHQVNEWRSLSENLPSPGETKNTPIKNTPSDAEAPDTSGLPIDWQIGMGKEKIILPDNNEARMKDTANLIAMGTGSMSSLYYSLSLAFMKARNIVIPESKVKGQRKAIKEMVESNVLPANVEEAVRRLVTKGMTVVDLFSVSKTAIDLANKPEVFSGERSHAL